MIEANQRTTISHGSVVTLLTCGGIFNIRFIANSLESVSLKDIFNRAILIPTIFDISVA